MLKQKYLGTRMIKNEGVEFVRKSCDNNNVNKKTEKSSSLVLEYNE